MKHGDVENALKLFDKLPMKNAVSWTVLIGGFVKKDCYEQALECFR
jgi:hypothetical protein